MNDTSNSAAGGKTAKKRDRKEERLEREAEALRANLRRRKEQARAREDSAGRPENENSGRSPDD